MVNQRSNDDNDALSDQPRLEWLVLFDLMEIVQDGSKISPRQTWEESNYYAWDDELLSLWTSESVSLRLGGGWAGLRPVLSARKHSQIPSIWM